MIDKSINNKYPTAVSKYLAAVGLPIDSISQVSFDRFVEYFDEEGLYIGITCDADGIFWIPEICSQPLMVCSSRDAAQKLAVEKCFEMIEETVNYAVY